jgi:hypothetical protein
MITLGGSIKGANLEVHAIQFVAADSVEDTYSELQNRWYGDSLHIDSITPLEYIDGYQIIEGGTSEKIPYLIVYGGYQTGVIDELHTYHIVLANTPKEAKKIAKTDLSKFPNMNHVDEVVDMFENVGTTFGLQKAECFFQDNITTHTFIKLG